MYNKLVVDFYKCQELVESVKEQKNNALAFSLMQVAKAFKEMFKKLVPSSGAGYLKWIFNENYTDRDEDDDDDEILVSHMHITFLVGSLS